MCGTKLDWSQNHTQIQTTWTNPTVTSPSSSPYTMTPPGQLWTPSHPTRAPPAPRSPTPPPSPGATPRPTELCSGGEKSSRPPTYPSNLQPHPYTSRQPAERHPAHAQPALLPPDRPNTADNPRVFTYPFYFIIIIQSFYFFKLLLYIIVHIYLFIYSSMLKAYNIIRSKLLMSKMF